MKKYLSCFLLAIAAGIAISIGGVIYLSLDNKVVGACMFAVGLCAVCTQGFFLYTGKIGYLVTEQGRLSYVLILFLTLVGNYIGTVITAEAIRAAEFNALIDKAVTMTAAKTAYSALRLVICGILCGILMYVAVDGYKKTKSLLILIMCVATFILCGFEHCVADMFYLALAREWTWNTFRVIGLVTVGNTVGGMLIPTMQLLKEESK